MKSALTIVPPTWMMNEDLGRVMDALGKDNARLVGGCIRNHLMNFPVKDIDIATKIIPEDVIAALRGQDIKVVPTGVKFGTVTAIIGDQQFEITTLRKDVETDGRHTKVDYTDDWREDAGRRDFTINALYADRGGNIYDPLGTGIDDVEKRRVRFIGDPVERIKEDYLRILRYFRFAARYGAADIDRKSFDACHTMREGIMNLSAERITDEMEKILNDASAPDAVALMHQAQVFSEYMTIEGGGHTLERLIALQDHYNAANVYSRFYHVFCDMLNIKIFNFSNRVKSYFNNLNKMMSDDILNIPLMLYRYGREVTMQGLLLRAAENGSDISLQIDRVMTESVPVFPLSAGAVMNALNLSEGPAVGKALQRAESIWVDSGFSVDADFLINKIK